MLILHVFTRNVASRVFTWNTAPPTGAIFEIDRGIIGTNLLFKKTAPPTGGHTNILTNFELDRGIIGINLLTKFHEDRTRNVASRVFTNKIWTTDGRTDEDKDQSQKLT
ncbi:hypothetical protein DPMN_102496 [Dreissena polymorpha]|uniref:Uncharacterized protein n=1 Tax=Dreissena polymorpha TaxID=45954 RepID=A0A9D4LN07_DREPO|nr:hypothetical protein DPMN_102496 [Dreissena polymorpha]